jgi:uncharacterized MnhB-related membrane protein
MNQINKILRKVQESKFLTAVALFVLVFFFLGLIARPDKTPAITGDGFEYLLMTRAFVARLAPSVQLAEAEAMANDPGNTKAYLLRDPRFDLLQELTLQPDVQRAAIWFRGRDGGIYSWHFWLYSLFVAPFLLLAMLAGFGDIMASLLANLFLASMALVAILMLHRGSRLHRFVLSTAFLCAGTVYYLRWTHPEVFTASLLMIGLLLLRRGHLKSAGVLLALAGQQNPPVLLLLPIVFLMDFVHLKAARFACWKKFVLAWVGTGVIAGLAIGFSLYEFGVPNLISIHAADKSLISAARVLSLYFNPNFGGFYAAPLLFAGLIALPFCFWSERREDGANVKWALLFAAMSVILAIPSTVTLNFNPGVQIVHRYSYWILVPVIMLLGEMMQSILLRQKTLLAGIAAGQIFFTHCLYGLPLGSSTRFTIAELILLDHFPRLYNPVPEIFAERGNNRDGIFDDFYSLSSNDVHFWVYHGEIRKILFHGKDKIASFPKCLDQSSLETHVVSEKEVENGYRYWNLRKSCRTDLMDGYSNSAYFAFIPMTQKWRACDLPVIDASARVNKETCEVTSLDNSSGTVTYGPYIQIAQGNYSFEIEYAGVSSTSATDIGDWDVAVSPSAVVLEKGSLPSTNGNRGTLRGTFTLPPRYVKDTVEIRTYVRPGASLTIHGIELKRID